MTGKLVWTIALVSAVAGLVYLASRDPEPWIILLAVIVFLGAFHRRFGLLNRTPKRRVERAADLRTVSGTFPRAPLPDLEWTGSSGDGFELRAGGVTYATLQFDHAYFALARTANDRWAFDHKGWFSTSVVVRREVEDDVVAVMALSGAREGILERPDGGGRFTRLWWSGDTWDTEDDWVVRYHNTSEYGTHQARVEIDTSILELPELPLVVVLGWYLTHAKQVAARRAS